MRPLRHPRRPVPPRSLRQRGVAVVTALLLTTLSIAIVASLFWQQQVQVRSMENQRLHLQTKWILRGALDWAMLVLRQDAYDNPNYTSLDAVWATPLAETRLDQYIERERVAGEKFDATLSGKIEDACARFNVRNLAVGGFPDKDAILVFKQLLRNLQMDPRLADKAAEFVAATQPVDPAAFQNITGGATAPTLQPGARSGVTGKPIKLLQLDDLVEVKGFTPGIIERLRPFVIVLPFVAQVNVNTASPEVLSAVIENMSVSEANSLVFRRKQAPWRNQGEFDLVLNGRKPIARQTAFNSEWFMVDSRIRLDRAALDAEALVHRPLTVSQSGGPGSGTAVVWIRQH